MASCDEKTHPTLPTPPGYSDHTIKFDGGVRHPSRGTMPPTTCQRCDETENLTTYKMRDDDWEVLFCEECHEKYYDLLTDWDSEEEHRAISDSEEEEEEEMKEEVHDRTNPAMMSWIDKVFSLCEAMDIRNAKNFTCCQTCGHERMKEEGFENYVFYHEQTGENLREGADECRLLHSMNAETKEKFLAVFSGRDLDFPERVLLWTGEDRDTIYLTINPTKAEAHRKDLPERTKMWTEMDSKKASSREYNPEDVGGDMDGLVDSYLSYLERKFAKTTQ